MKRQECDLEPHLYGFRFLPFLEGWVDDCSTFAMGRLAPKTSMSPRPSLSAVCWLPISAYTEASLSIGSASSVCSSSSSWLPQLHFVHCLRSCCTATRAVFIWILYFFTSSVFFSRAFNVSSMSAFQIPYRLVVRRICFISAYPLLSAHFLPGFPPFLLGAHWLPGFTSSLRRSASCIIIRVG